MSRNEALRRGVKTWEWKERSAEVRCSLQWGSSSRRLLPSAFKAPSFNKWLWHLRFSWEESGDDTKEDTENGTSMNHSRGQTVKENVPRLSRAKGGCKRTCWQHRRGITLLHSCRVETSWLNHTPRRPEHQSNNYQDSCRLKVTVLVLAELRSVWST